MILYHGTTIPIEVIRTKGLQAHSVEAILDFIMMRVKNPLIVAKDLRRALRRGPGWPEWGTVRFSYFRSAVYEYIKAPPEIISDALLQGLPTSLALEAITALIEVSNGRVLGKIVTVDIPRGWITGRELRTLLKMVEKEEMEPLPPHLTSLKEVYRGDLEELVVTRDVGPQYIKNIESVYVGSLEEILAEVVGTPEEEALAEFFANELIERIGPPPFIGKRIVLW